MLMAFVLMLMNRGLIRLKGIRLKGIPIGLGSYSFSRVPSHSCFCESYFFIGVLLVPLNLHRVLLIC